MTADQGQDPKKIFREAALKKRLQEESGDDLLTIVPHYNRLGLYFLLGVTLLTLFWLFFGALPVEIKGTGIFMNEKGLFGIEAQSRGFVNQILVQPESIVKKGDPLIILSDSKQDVSLEYANKQLSFLENQYETLKARYAAEELKLKTGLQQQIDNNKKKIEKLEKEIPTLEKDYEKKQNLVKEGLVSTTTVLEAQNLLLQRKTALETTKSTIASLEANLTKTYHAEELKSLEQRILEQKQTKDILELNKRFSQITSPFDVHVLEVLVRVGDPVVEGKNTIWVESANNQIKDIIVFAFVNPDIGKRITIGQQIYVQPTIINAQEFGSIICKVINVSPTMMANEEIEAFIHDKGLEAYLTRGIINPYLLTIEPKLDPTTISGLKWTSQKGGPFIITTGTVCTISGVAFYERPIVTLLPLWRIDTLTNETKKWFESWVEKDSSVEDKAI